jgi:hypothetical protein
MTRQELVSIGPLIKNGVLKTGSDPGFGQQKKAVPQDGPVDGDAASRAPHQNL